MSYKFNLDGFSVSDANVCTADGGFVGDVTGQFFGIKDTYGTDGAIDLSRTLVSLSGNTGTCDMTLAVGTAGQVMYLYAVNTSNSVTVSFGGISPAFNLVTFNAAGDTATLICTGTEWVCTSLTGTAALS